MPLLFVVIIVVSANWLKAFKTVCGCATFFEPVLTDKVLSLIFKF